MSDKTLLRGAYERVARLFGEDKFIFSTQIFRMEQPLAPNKSQYTFQLKQGNTSTDGPSQILMNDEDACVLVGLSLGVVKHNLTESPPAYGTFPIFYYPDAQVFAGIPVTGIPEWQSLLAIWNGSIEFRTESLVRLKPTSTTPYLYVPETQVMAGSPDTAQNTQAQFGGRGWASNAFVEQQPTFLLDGKQSNNFILNLGAGDYTAIDGRYNAEGEAEDSRNYLVLQALTILVANGSQEAKRFANPWII